MGNVGRLNPYPRHYGGTPSPPKRVHRALRSAMGTANGKKRDNTGPLHGIEDGWRQAKARAIETQQRFDELAMLQFFPQRSTALLPDHELTLGLPSTGSLTARQAAADAKQNDRAKADNPTLTALLQAIDSNLSILSQDDATSITTIPGRWVEPHGSYPGFDSGTGNLTASLLPNYSTRYITLVRWTGATSTPPQDKLDKVIATLNDKLPAWQDWRLENESATYIAGFSDYQLGWI